MIQPNLNTRRTTWTYFVVDSVEESRHDGQNGWLQHRHVLHQQLDVTAEEADPSAVHDDRLLQGALEGVRQRQVAQVNVVFDCTQLLQTPGDNMYM